MKRILTLVSILLCATVATAQNGVTLKTYADSLSWAVGESYARAFLTTPFELNNDIMAQAFLHTLNGQKQPISDSTYISLMEYITMFNYRYKKELKQRQEDSIAAVEQHFIDSIIRQNPNIQRTTEGFYYEILRQGTGAQVKENYRATFDFRNFNMFTGEMYNQSYGKTPITTVVNDHIFLGLNKGLQMMNEGSHYRFYFPSRVAFGADGSRTIPPYTPIIYEVEVYTVHND